MQHVLPRHGSCPGMFSYNAQLTPCYQWLPCRLLHVPGRELALPDVHPPKSCMPGQALHQLSNPCQASWPVLAAGWLRARGCELHSMRSASCSRDSSLQEPCDEQKCCSDWHQQPADVVPAPAYSQLPADLPGQPGGQLQQHWAQECAQHLGISELKPNTNCNLLLAGAPVCLPAADVLCTVCPLLYMGRIGRLPGTIVCQFCDQCATAVLMPRRMWSYSAASSSRA